MHQKGPSKDKSYAVRAPDSFFPKLFAQVKIKSVRFSCFIILDKSLKTTL